MFSKMAKKNRTSYFKERTSIDSVVKKFLIDLEDL